MASAESVEKSESPAKNINEKKLVDSLDVREAPRVRRVSHFRRAASSMHLGEKTQRKTVSWSRKLEGQEYSVGSIDTIAHAIFNRER